jgi:isopropylmalate/homocitrate/citramalate synthase
MGERAGNAPLESTVINDFMPEIAINVKRVHYTL